MLTLKIMSNDYSLDDGAPAKTFGLMSGVMDVDFIRPCYGSMTITGYLSSRDEDGKRERFTRHVLGAVYVMNDRGRTIATFAPTAGDVAVWETRGDLEREEPSYPKDATREQVEGFQGNH